MDAQKNRPINLQGRLSRLRGIRHMPASSNGMWPEAFDLNTKTKSKTGQRGLQPRSTYRNICHEEDPPRTVAISPSRQCLAFGCRDGVELYWTDRRNGQSLNRWFPLSKPSDHLYFVPPRRHIDGLSKLRLISSSAHPGSQPQLNDNDQDPATQSSSSSLWSTLTGPWRLPATRPGKKLTQSSDHSHALPLSDGHHILFTDDKTGLLCLGSDEPHGRAQKLSRKFTFEPPYALWRAANPPVPLVYAAASNLENGVRLVAAYGNDVVLYSVPVDALRFSIAEQEQTIQLPTDDFGQTGTLKILEHPISNASAVHDILDDEAAGAHFDEVNMVWMKYLPAGSEHDGKTLGNIWPLKIPGQWIGTLEDVSALSVHETETEELAVWAFGKTGVAKVWRVDAGREDGETKKKVVGKDGVVRDVAGVTLQIGDVSFV